MNKKKSTVKLNKSLSRFEIFFSENKEDQKKKKRKSIHDSIDLVNNLIGNKLVFIKK